MSSFIDFRSVVQNLLAADPSANVYFLLDHGGLPGLHRQLTKCVGKWVSLFANTKEQNALTASPFLVLAAGSGQLRLPRSFFTWISENGTYTSSVIILSSPQPIELLKIRLAARLEVKLSENMNAMLRFFDPRVLESLSTLLSSEQASQFFSPAQQWIFVNRAGELIDFASKFSSSEDFVSPLLLTQQQEFHLLECCETDQVLNLLRENIPQCFSRIPIEGQYEFVLERIIEAKAQGLDSVLKLSVYAWTFLSRGLSVGSPTWRRILNEISQSNFDFLESE